MKFGIFAFLILACSLARAQTYDLSITMSNLENAPGSAGTFSGSFTYKNGVLSDIHVNDPTDWGGTFTAGTVSGKSIMLVDTYDGVPGQSSDVVYLSFGLNTALGGSGPVHINLNTIAFGDYFDLPDACGGIPGLIGYNAPHCVSASLKAVTAAPEIGFDGALLTLLAGALCVLTGRRHGFVRALNRDRESRRE
jgi:hypothetical protein